MLPLLSPSLDQLDAEKWLGAVNDLMRPGEKLVAVARIAAFFPSADRVAVTDSRLLMFQAGTVAEKGALIDVFAVDITELTVDTRLGGRTLMVHTTASEPRRLGVLQRADTDFILMHANRVAQASAPIEPTVSVYDPFSMPAPTAPDASATPTNQKTRAQQAAPPRLPQQKPTAVPAPDPPMRAVGAVEVNRRLVPLWKVLPAYLVAAFFALVATVSLFDPVMGVGLFCFFMSLALIPLLAITRARFNSVKRRAKAEGVPEVHRLLDRNWLPVGIPLIIILFATGIALG